MVIIGSDNTSNGTGTTNGGTAVAIAADAIKCIIINKWAILNVISATDINVRRQTMNCEIHLQNRQTYKQKRTTALAEWFQICAS